MRSIYIILFAALILISCQKETPVTPAWKGLVLPEHFGATVKTPIPVTQAGFELGRKLFNDPLLSRDNTISCGSCHIQGSAFTHHGHDVSHGIDDQLGKRNAPAIQNLLWQQNYFWDGGVHNIDLISINPIENPVEMDEKIANVLDKIRKNENYRSLFSRAFNSDKIETAHFLEALAMYMEMLISDRSKYDLYLQGKSEFTPDEKEGLEIFAVKCGSCHTGVLQSDNSFRNNGLFSNNYDKGRYDITLNDGDIGKFKVPSLRNIALTAPYMHNGTIGSLEGVLNHYTLNVKDSPTLDRLLKQNGRLGIELSQEEKRKIIAFLNTLTDEQFIKDPLFGE